jgi:predicted MFS family arabinose efflux permease
MNRIKGLFTYENRLVSIFFLSWGLIFLDRQIMSILLPLIIRDVPLTNGEIGQVNMWQTICVAISAPTVALLADRIGSRKLILFVAIVATSVLSALTMAANSLVYLIVVRSLLGVSEGVVLPLAIALIAAACPPNRLGRNVGLVYAGAAVIASTIGPTVVTQVATATSWRSAFLFVSVPSLLAAALVWFFVTDTGPRADTQPVSGPTRATLVSALRNRNIIICVLISVFAMAGGWTFNSFITLYLTEISELSITTAGLVMSLFGIFTIFWQVFLPYSSDRIGRKPAMIFYAALASTTPILLFLFPRSVAVLVVYVVIGGIFLTLPALFISIIPVESVPASVMATAGALIMGVGELISAFVVGGAGQLADRYGLGAIMATSGLSYLVVVLVSGALKETKGRAYTTTEESEITTTQESEIVAAA